jgi:hypothetical protein
MRRAGTCIATAVLLGTCTGPQGDSPTTPDAAPAKGGPAIKSVQVSPSSASIQVGQTVQLTATTKPTTSGTIYTWSSNSGAVATVNSSGLVTAVSAGTATIRASAGGKTGNALITVIAAPPPPPPPPPPESVTFVGTGDIADCASSGDEATAALLDGIPGSVFTLGDNVYPNGTQSEYNTCYGAQTTWGRHKARTFPSAGNHEYNTPGATGYYGYFGAAAGDPTKGYYSFDLGAWHVIVLNSNIARDASSAQVEWLRADLTAHSAKSCTIAYWHHPRFSSGFVHGNNITVQAFWDVLYQFNADVIMGGHDHDYERFAPQTPTALADNVRGIRQFVVGTGGKSLYSQGVLKANSEVFYNGTAGVLKLTLYDGGYTWEFVPVSGSFSDTGVGTCH